MTVPNGAAGINTTDGLFLVSANGHGDLSAADLVGQDENTVRAVLGQKYVTNGTSVLSSPTSPLSQVFGGFAGLPGMLAAMFGKLIGIDLSGATSITGLLGVVQQVPVLSDFFNLLNGLWSGLTGSPTGTQQTTATVSGAVGAQTSTIAALGASLNGLTQQSTATSTGAILAVDAFTRTGTDLGPDWDVEIVNDFASSGYVKTNGTQAIYVPSGFGNTYVLARFQGTNHTAATDTTETAVVLGTPLSAQFGPPTAVDIHGRMSPDRATSVRARILTQSLFGTANILQLHSRVAGVETLIGSQDLGSMQPAVGTIAKLRCGTDVSARQFLVILNNKVYTFTESGTTSQLGAGFQERGMGWISGGSWFGQSQAGAVEHWTSIDVGAAGGSTGGGALILDGGTPTAPGSPIYDGGTPSTPGSPIYDGGTP